MKVGILQVLEVLQKHSDVDHSLTATQIIEYLEKEYGACCTRQTIYKMIEELNSRGIEILSNSSRTGWYYCDRLLEEAEVHLLCHSIISNNTIPSEQSNQLMDKVLSTQSIYFQGRFKNKLNLHNLEKKENKELFYNIEVLSEAIDEKKKISFQYTKYNLDKEIILRSDKNYQLIPHFILFKNNRMYLVGFDEKYQNMTQYRVDRMINVEIQEECHTMSHVDPYEYARTRLYMHGGELEVYKIYCDESLLDEVLDIFGKEIKLEEADGGFYATIETTKQEIIYFAFQFIEYVQVIEPIEVVCEIKEILKRASGKYK